MRHTFFARPCNAAAKCAVGSACSAANTDNNSILLLTIDTVLAVSIFAILSILGIAPPAERTKPVFARAPVKHPKLNSLENRTLQLQ